LDLITSPVEYPFLCSHSTCGHIEHPLLGHIIYYHRNLFNGEGSGVELGEKEFYLKGRRREKKKKKKKEEEEEEEENGGERRKRRRRIKDKAFLRSPMFAS